MESPAERVPEQRPALSFATAIPIAILGGLIGLGGAEFRLPVLMGRLRYSAKQAVPLNLSVSLVTIVVSLLIRGWSLSPESLQPFFPAIAAIIGGAVVAAFAGVSLASRLSKEQLERVIVVLLVLIGIALIVEGFLPQRIPALLPANPMIHVIAGVLFGLAIGTFSSLLGVAGGELIIPTLLFAYGVDIRIAGTASLIISLPTVVVGILRYASRGAFMERRPLTGTVAPMALGSVIGAIAGASMAGLTPVWILKIGLGVILIVSAGRMYRHLTSSTSRS